ncbi:kinase-like protein [Gonapodya prolifera JEL478]|uniref:Kinase-like protein n=1 Tax=Gonapodya prolifera (strain JEL478) TaxID=1344416 RepID=A0A139AX96_GONPJ|nr:kinase-like protein [Gonapodya prolifera JEL478]|eukprot:KXS21348.1 kinase-like protein [Gonapodya prolifera JEL478]
MGFLDKVFGGNKKPKKDGGVNEAQTRMARYKRLSLLGKGNQGEVHRALDTKTGVEVALKICYKRHLNVKHDFISTSSTPRLKEIFVLEQITSSGHTHPNLANLLEWWEDRTSIVMVSELATGGELFEKIVEKGSYTEGDAATIAATLCNVVAYLHKHGIVHRDIKTENLLFRNSSSTSDLLLVDFGLAGILEQENAHSLSTVVGTPIYIAPEIANTSGPRKYGVEADCWSLGVVTYCLLVGYGPFGMGDFEGEPMSLATSIDILRAGPTFDGPEWRPISPLARDFVRSLLQFDPTKRMSAYQSLYHPWIRTFVPREYIEQLWNLNQTLLRDEGVLSEGETWGGWSAEDLDEFARRNAEGKTTVVVANCLIDIEEDEDEAALEVQPVAGHSNNDIAAPAEHPTHPPQPQFVPSPMESKVQNETTVFPPSNSPPKRNADRRPTLPYVLSVAPKPSAPHGRRMSTVSTAKPLSVGQRTASSSSARSRGSAKFIVVEEPSAKRKDTGDNAYLVEIPTNPDLDNLIGQTDTSEDVSPPAPVSITGAKSPSRSAAAFAALRRTQTGILNE